MTRPVVLVFTGYYLPGYKSGGPLRSISNLIQALGRELDFRIVTRDRDLGDEQPYAGIVSDVWSKIGGIPVFYCSEGNATINVFRKLLTDTACDQVYLNSFFDPVFTLKVLLALRGRQNSPRVVLAPRGEFSRGALALKRYKKRAYIWMASLMGLYRQVRWQASTEFEADDIARVMGVARQDILVARDLVVLPKGRGGLVEAGGSQEDGLRLVFLSRISPMKNLEFVLTVLAMVSRQKITFDIFGPVENEPYWLRCRALMGGLPEGVVATYRGELRPEQVEQVLCGYDLMILPSWGENFGHVVAEAMAVGTPVLVSTNTPWRHLEAQGVGWDLPLDEPERFAEKLVLVAKMDRAEKWRWRQSVAEVATALLESSADVQANRALFFAGGE